MELVGNIARRSCIRQAATPSRRTAAEAAAAAAAASAAAAAAEAAAAAAATTHRTAAAAGSARRSLSRTPLARWRSQMEHSMLTPPPERRKALASLSSWEDF